MLLNITLGLAALAIVVGAVLLVFKKRKAPRAQWPFTGGGGPVDPDKPKGPVNPE